MDPLPGSRVGDWKGLKNEVKDAPRAFRLSFYCIMEVGPGAHPRGAARIPT